MESELKDIKQQVVSTKDTIAAIKDNEDRMSCEINDLRTQVDANEINRIRFEILNFAASLRTGHEHSKEEFDHIMKLDEKYKGLLQKYNISNGVYTINYELIVDKYKEYLKNGFPC